MVAVTAAVTVVVVLVSGDGVDLGCGVGYFAKAVEDLVALVEELGGFVACGAGRVGGGEVVFDALDGGGRLLAPGFGIAEVLSRGQVVGEHRQQGVGEVAAVGGADEDQFGVGGRGGFGEPAQLLGWRWSASSTMTRLPAGSFQRLFSMLVRASWGVVVVSA